MEGKKPNSFNPYEIEYKFMKMAMESSENEESVEDLDNQSANKKGAPSFSIYVLIC